MKRRKIINATRDLLDAIAIRMPHESVAIAEELRAMWHAAQPHERVIIAAVTAALSHPSADSTRRRDQRRKDEQEP
jgi:hypothetical protein